jgi:hypothetical protein
MKEKKGTLGRMRNQDERSERGRSFRVWANSVRIRRDSQAGLHLVASNMELGAGDLDVVLMILDVPCKK